LASLAVGGPDRSAARKLAGMQAVSSNIARTFFAAEPTQIRTAGLFDPMKAGSLVKAFLEGGAGERSATTRLGSPFWVSGPA
jgi:hypothetical protein